MTIAEILQRANEGRRERTYPRVIKKVGCKFPGKQLGQTGRAHNPVLEIRHPLASLLI